MAKIGATNPLTGGKFDLSIRGILGLVLGGLVIWGVAATSQNLGKAITSKVNNKYVDFTPDPIAAAEVTKVDSSVFLG